MLVFGEDERLQNLQAEIRERLRKVCSHMPENEFEKLVEDVAANARKAELRDAPWRHKPADG